MSCVGEDERGKRASLRVCGRDLPTLLVVANKRCSRRRNMIVTRIVMRVKLEGGQFRGNHDDGGGRNTKRETKGDSRGNQRSTQSAAQRNVGMGGQGRLKRCTHVSLVGWTR